MNNQYNSDKIWQDKLGNHELKAPMHLFDRIDQKRTFGYKVRNQIRLHRSKFMVGLLFLFFMCSGGIGWMMSDMGMVTSDRGRVTSDKGMVTSDRGRVTSDKGMVMSDRGLVTSDKGIVTSDKGMVTSDRGRVTSDKGMVASDKGIVASKPEQRKTTAPTKYNTHSLSKAKRTTQKENTAILTKGGLKDFVDAKIPQIEENTLNKTTALQHNNTTALTTTTPKNYNTRSLSGVEMTELKENTTRLTKGGITDFVDSRISQTEENTQNKTTALQHHSTRSLSGVEMTALNKIPTKELTISLSETTNAPDNGCRNFNQRPKTKFTVDVLAWGNYNDKKLGLQNNAMQESNDYVTQRENTEKTRYGVGGGVRISVDLPIDISLRTGLFYNQIHERFDLVDTNASRTIIYTNNITGISDTLNETGTHIMETYNYYRTLDIPVLVGYTFKKGNMYAGVNGGILFNILLKQKGHILKADNQPTLITNNSSEEGETYFKNNIGLQLYGGIEFGYKVNERIDFLIEPHVRHMLNSITQYNHPLSQKYTTYGLSGGLRFKF